MNLESFRHSQAYTQEFDRRPNQSPLLIKRNLESLISERFNVLLSTTHYELGGGKVFGQGETEPFSEVLVRGREYRKLHGNPIDWEREEAEVRGFEKVEKIMTDLEMPEGTMVLSFSLKGQEGSSYQHNFYDILAKRRDERGYYLEARRYSSALTAADAARFYLEMGFGAQEEVADQAFFLSNPIAVRDSRFKTPDDLHRYLHRDHVFTPVEVFRKIIEGAQASISDYVYNPTPYNFNKALNAADILGGFRKGDVKDAMLGYLPVRQVMTGCGASGRDPDDSPYSVSAYGLRDIYGNRAFDCPECGKKNVRPKDKLIKNCQHCGTNKVAC